MIITGLALAGIAALVHVFIFYLESIAWTGERARAVFGTGTAEQAAATREIAFNQGFYNLFLAVQTVVGVVLVASGTVGIGVALVVAGVGSMLAAALVLVGSDRRRARTAATQGTIPALTLLALLVHALV